MNGSKHQTANGQPRLGFVSNLSKGNEFLSMNTWGPKMQATFSACDFTIASHAIVAIEGVCTLTFHPFLGAFDVRRSCRRGDTRVPHCMNIRPNALMPYSRFSIEVGVEKNVAFSPALKNPFHQPRVASASMCWFSAECFEPVTSSVRALGAHPTTHNVTAISLQEFCFSRVAY